MAWVVRGKKGLVIRNHGQKAATPYLRKWLPKLAPEHAKKSLCVDIGCGNLRNTSLALEHGFRVIPIDHHDDAVLQKDVGADLLPVKDGKGKLILMQFMLMFLKPKERTHLYGEVNRIAAPGAHVVIELEDVKSAVAPSSIKQVLKGMGPGWEIVNQGKMHCILKRSGKTPMRVSQLIRYAIALEASFDAECRACKVGKLTPTAIYVHLTAVKLLPPALRQREQKARRCLGDLGGANVIKLHRREPRVSYLSYPQFDTDPHPALSQSVLVTLPKTVAKPRDYSQSDNPPILHRKEEFVGEKHPKRALWASLTAAEEDAGLYSNTNTIGTRNGWTRALKSRKLGLQGHRLIKFKR